MKDSSTFIADSNVSLLLMGEPGSGKTCVAMGFDNPYFLSTDRKLGNAVRLYPKKEFKYDYPSDDKDGKLLPIEKRWSNILTMPPNPPGMDLLKNCSDPWIKTIVVDNLTDISAWLQAYIISQPALSKNGRPLVAGERIMEMADWQPFQVLMDRFIINLKSFGKTVVVCCHASTDKDDMTGVLRYRPHIGGQLKDLLPSKFSDFWMCSVIQTGANSHRYFVRTMPTSQVTLINSLGLPVEFDFSAEELRKKMGTK